MLKKSIRSSILLIAFLVSVGHYEATYAQVTGSSPNIITGGDPQPTGEPDAIQILGQIVLFFLAVS